MEPLSLLIPTAAADLILEALDIAAKKLANDAESETESLKWRGETLAKSIKMTLTADTIRAALEKK